MTDYYVQPYPDGTSDFDSTVDPYHHGVRYGSNTLFLDMHVAASSYPRTHPGALDPWDLPKLQ